VKHLIVGGARSGKSGYAEGQAKALSASPVYLATGQGRDGEMQSRIAHHQAQRGSEWQLIEEPITLADALIPLQSQCVVIDCLTLWLSNCLEHGCWEDERSRFLTALEQHESDIFMVGNELGSGIVPLGELTREFVDENGRLHQDIAARCSHVSTVIAGLPLSLKGNHKL
jgi:adenosylcobinamide kinase/adenosylcobinamide-phosphate guanylyltransferase